MMKTLYSDVWTCTKMWKMLFLIKVYSKTVYCFYNGIFLMFCLKGKSRFSRFPSKKFYNIDFWVGQVGHKCFRLINGFAWSFLISNESSQNAQTFYCLSLSAKAPYFKYINLLNLNPTFFGSVLFRLTLKNLFDGRVRYGLEKFIKKGSQYVTVIRTQNRAIYRLNRSHTVNCRVRFK